MTQKGRDKLFMRGWTILRKDDTFGVAPGIKVYNYNSSWKLVDRYKTKAARDREFKRLLDDHCTIED